MCNCIMSKKTMHIPEFKNTFLLKNAKYHSPLNDWYIIFLLVEGLISILMADVWSGYGC